MSRALERDELPPVASASAAAGAARERVLVAVDDEHRTANAPAELPEVVFPIGRPMPASWSDERLRVVSSAQPTPSSIGFVECGSVKHCADEELEEVP